MKYAQLHCHTIYSNNGGVESISTPEKLLQTSRDNSTKILAITDHNTMEGYKKPFP